MTYKIEHGMVFVQKENKVVAWALWRDGWWHGPVVFTDGEDTRSTTKSDVYEVLTIAVGDCQKKLRIGGRDKPTVIQLL